jgi:VIT1/CCC1 family predicted Fe2+/Mn2+ transporter
VVPLLAGAFIPDWRSRIIAVCVVTVAMLIGIGALGAHLGGANHGKGALRVLLGGGIAMAVT